MTTARDVSEAMMRKAVLMPRPYTADMTADAPVRRPFSVLEPRGPRRSGRAALRAVRPADRPLACFAQSLRRRKGTAAREGRRHGNRRPVRFLVSLRLRLARLSRSAAPVGRRRVGGNRPLFEAAGLERRPGAPPAGGGPVEPVR